MTTSSRKYIVLVVEDEDDDRKALVKMLQYKFQKDNILEASNGKEALEILKNNNPNIIMTDIRMPIMDGVTMIKHIRESDNNVPIIVVSAFEQELFDFEKYKIDYYLLKPVTIIHLIGIIQRFLEGI